VNVLGFKLKSLLNPRNSHVLTDETDSDKFLR